MAIAQGQKLVIRLASANGDGTGTTDAIGDYSSTPLTLKFAPSAYDAYQVSRAIISIQDTGSLDSGAYGNNITLTNGITCDVSDGSGVVYSLTAFPIVTNADWAAHCHDAVLHSYGLGDEVYSVRWTFAKTGSPVVVDGSRGQFLQFTLNDDFTGLNHHRFIVQGFYLDEKV